jgi:hypothetical protein
MLLKQIRLVSMHIGNFGRAASKPVFQHKQNYWLPCRPPPHRRQTATSKGTSIAGANEFTFGLANSITTVSIRVSKAHDGFARNKMRKPQVGRRQRDKFSPSKKCWGPQSAGLVAREQLDRRAPPRLILEVDIGQRLPGAVSHDKGSRSPLAALRNHWVPDQVATCASTGRAFGNGGYGSTRTEPRPPRCSALSTAGVQSNARPLR